MVEQSRRPVQAGPGEEAEPNGSLRDRNRAARALGLQLAAIGDQLVRERGGRESNRRPPAVLLLLGPAQTLTRRIYRDFQTQLWGVQGPWGGQGPWGVQGLRAAFKAWRVKSPAGQGVLGPDAFTSWVCSVSPASRVALASVSFLALVLAVVCLDWKP